MENHFELSEAKTWMHMIFLFIVPFFMQGQWSLSTYIHNTLKNETTLSLLSFCVINAGVLYVYFSSFQQIDEEDYGGTWELTKEGFMTSFALFLVRAELSNTEWIGGSPWSLPPVLPFAEEWDY